MWEGENQTTTEKLFLLCAQHVCIDHNDIVSQGGCLWVKKHLETLESPKNAAVAETGSYNVRLQRKQSIQFSKEKR